MQCFHLNFDLFVIFRECGYTEAAGSKGIFSESVSYMGKMPIQKATLDVAANGN